MFEHSKFMNYIDLYQTRLFKKWKHWFMYTQNASLTCPWSVLELTSSSCRIADELPPWRVNMTYVVLLLFNTLNSFK